MLALVTPKTQIAPFQAGKALPHLQGIVRACRHDKGLDLSVVLLFSPGMSCLRLVLEHLGSKLPLHSLMPEPVQQSVRMVSGSSVHSSF